MIKFHLLILFGFLASCSSVTFHADVAQTADQVDAARLQNHLEQLTALGPRRAGDGPTGEATVRYLETELSKMGLKSTREVFSLTPHAQVTLLLKPLNENGEVEENLEAVEVPVPGTYFMANSRQSRVLQGIAEISNVSHRLSGFRQKMVAGTPVDQINLFVTFPGAIHPERILEVSAHHDTVPATTGADDNTSGVVVLLEAARLLKTHPPACTVRLCFFAAEEIGLLGSGEHVRRMDEEGRLDDVFGLINLDGVGHFTNEEDSQNTPIRIPFLVWPPSTGNFLTIIGGYDSADLAHLVEDCGDLYTPDLPLYTLARLGTYIPDATRSDHAHYWAVGIPAVFLSDTGEFRGDNYHRPSDDLQGIDYPALRKVTALTVSATLEAAIQIAAD